MCQRIYHLQGKLRGTHLRQAWIFRGVLFHEDPLPQLLRAPKAELNSIEVCEINGFIYPGLLDAHTHIGLNHSDTPPSKKQMRQRLAACAQRGVTAIRDCGGQRDPNLVAVKGMPKVLHCGQHIARFKRYTRHLAVEVEPENFVTQCEREAAKSGGWIKIVGDWIDRTSGDLAPLWNEKMLCAGVAAAHAAGAKVTVHTFAAETIPMLLRAKVDGIEHGTGMDFAQLQAARDAGIILTPTVNQISRFPEFAAAGQRFPRYQQRMRQLDAQRGKWLQMITQLEMPLLMGSDTAEDVAARGLWVELQDAVANGLPAQQVLAAASYHGRELLGFGAWGAGDPADFVVYETDPAENIATVTNPKYVFIDGELVHGELVSSVRLPRD